MSSRAAAKPPPKAGPPRRPSHDLAANAQDMRKTNMNSANEVTKDFLLFSQPFIHEGVLISSASSGRRVFIHQLAEIPLSEVFTTKQGNQIQREDSKTVKLAGTIALEVGSAPVVVPTAQLTAQIPTSAFTGPAAQRDEKVLLLLQKGKEANASSDFKTACACFEAAYALSVRAGMLVSAANMRLKLGMAESAAAMYRHVLNDSGLLASEREMATRKLAEAQAKVKVAEPTVGRSHASPGGLDAAFGRSADDFAAFGNDAGGDDWGDFGDSSPPPAACPPPAPPAPSGGFGAFEDDGGFDDFDDPFDEPPKPAAAPPPKPAAPPSPPKPAAASSASFGAFADGGFDDFDEDFASPAAPPPAPAAPLAPPAPRPAAAAGGFAAFDAPPAVRNGFGSFGEPEPSKPSPPAKNEAHFPPNGAAATGSIEARLAALERRESAREARVEKLEAALERRINGVKKGMEALHTRLQAVETAMSKLPEHLTKFNKKIKEHSKLAGQHSAVLRGLQHQLPALAEAADVCKSRVKELRAFSETLKTASPSSIAMSSPASVSHHATPSTFAKSPSKLEPMAMPPMPPMHPLQSHGHSAPTPSAPSPSAPAPAPSAPPAPAPAPAPSAPPAPAPAAPAPSAPATSPPAASPPAASPPAPSAPSAPAPAPSPLLKDPAASAPSGPSANILSAAMFSDMPSATSATPAAADFGDFGGFGGFGGEGESSAAEGSAPSSAGGAATSPLPSAPMTAAEAPPMEHAAPDGGVEAFGDFEDVEEPAANGGEEAPPAEAVGVDDFDDFGTPADDGAADGFAAFAAAPEASGAGAEAGGAASKAPPHADDSASGASTLSALEKRLSEAKVERERANIEMAADSFLTSLDAPLHRTRSFDSTPSEVDDLEFQNLTPVGSDADKLRALDAGGVTDDEFNALFGAD